MGRTSERAGAGTTTSPSPGTMRALMREARACLDAPDDARLAALAEDARAARGVPDARRADWDKLVAGFARAESAEKRRARVEGLLRACALFAPLALDAPVTRLAGIGGKGAGALAEAGVLTATDLAWTLPVGWDDLRAPLSVREALALGSPDGATPRVCVRAVVKSAGLVPMRGRRAVRVVLADEEGAPGAGAARSAPDAARATIHAWWFFAAHGVLASARPGAVCLMLGRVRRDPGKPARAAHPELLVVAPAPSARAEGDLPAPPAPPGVRPRYPRLGVPAAAMRKAIREALDAFPEAPDPVPPRIAAREGMRPAGPLLRAAHAASPPASSPPGDAPPDADTVRALVERLAWAEAFARVRARVRAEGRGDALALPVRADLAARLRAELGFPLTRGQDAAIAAIARELAGAAPMRRLLLGDVGTGKTAVALAAAAQCVGAGAQVAILAPTSVLAEQYMDAVGPLARATGASIALVAAGVPAAQRRRALEQLAQGSIAVAVGTHALLSEEVRFARLGLVVVDEQHRLGVAQRVALVGKGEGTRPHLLTLSATPIPRTLALALRGELATSTLDERPRGRPPVTTEMRPRSAIAGVVDDVRAACARGERVFFVSPRIEVPADDEDDEGRAPDPSAGAVARAEELSRALAPERVTLVHGAMRAEDKRRAMRAFRAGEAKVLVGTTVVEVGLDVPEATLMVIDHAERFGMAQLHQMRGRVGRGAVPGRCILLHDALDDLALRRLRAVCTLTDGAAIARADLELRGAGDLSGTRQHGAEEGLLFLDPAAPPAWILRVEADARALLAEDPELARPEHVALRCVAARFAHNIALREEAG